jgi:hypothetical protein
LGLVASWAQSKESEVAGIQAVTGQVFKMAVKRFQVAVIDRQRRPAFVADQVVVAFGGSLLNDPPAAHMRD